MSKFFNDLTPRQQDIVEGLSDKLGISTDSITGATFEAGVPVSLNYSNTSGTYNRDVHQFLGQIITDGEHEAIKAERAVNQATRQSQQLPVNGVGNRNGSDNTNKEFATAVVESLRAGFDPVINRLIASGLSNTIGSGSQKTSSEVQVRFKNGTDTRVRIYDPSGFIVNGGISAPLAQTDNAVIFPYTPSITVSYTSNYNSESLTHSNYEYLFYQSSSVDSISVTAKFTARSVEEAEYVLAAMHFFRTATKMFYGNSSPAGVPPVVCRLSGHGQYQFNRVPVVITNFAMDYPEDVDYISTSDGTRVPVFQSFGLSLKPLYSRKKASEFNYGEFANGNLIKQGYL